MAITVCTHPTRCADMEQAHGDMAAQLAAALAELGRARAALSQAQDQVTRLSGELQQARADAAFHLAGFACECRKAVRA